MTGAFAALAEYYSNNQGTQSDCGLDLGCASCPAFFAEFFSPSSLQLTLLERSHLSCKGC